MPTGSDARRRRSSIQALANPLSLDRSKGTSGSGSTATADFSSHQTIKAEVGLKDAKPIPGVDLAKLAENMKSCENNEERLKLLTFLIFIELRSNYLLI